MRPDLSVLDKEWRVDETTARAVAEGIWYADRHRDSLRDWSDTRHGLYWTHSGSHIISLAYGTGLHGNSRMDHELYVFRWPVDREVPESVCCHATRDEADRCALDLFRTNRWCSQWRYGVEELA